MEETKETKEMKEFMEKMEKHAKEYYRFEQDIKRFLETLEELELEKNGYDLTTCVSRNIVEYNNKYYKIFFAINKKNNDFEKSLIYFDSKEGCWELIKQHILLSGTPSTLVGTELFPNASPDIEYELFIFDDGSKLTPHELLRGHRLRKIKYQKNKNKDSNLVIPWTDKLSLEISFNNYLNNRSTAWSKASSSLVGSSLNPDFRTSGALSVIN